MNLKRFLLLLSIVLIFISIFGVYATSLSQNNQDIDYLLDNTDESELVGCCSVVLQLEGNNSVMSFRRDSNLTADIFIEEIDWHGMPAIKQYKTEEGYFCQVIITNNGWTIGYGGIDDGIDNEIIENITSTMITNDNSINEEKLHEIQEIKQKYQVGHLLIKAPNGNYGIATANTSFTGQLHPGDYVSIPNRESYFRSGSIPIGDSDKVKDVTELAATDKFGLSRRDITTFDYHSFRNETHMGNVVDIYLSNDNGSYNNLNCSLFRDDVHFKNKTFAAEDIPFCPNYQNLGSFESVHEIPDQPLWVVLMVLASLVMFVIILYVVIIRIVRYIRYKN